MSLSYMQARYHDGVTGRFLSMDSVTFGASGGNPGQFGAYHYANNNPVNFIDPNGLMAKETLQRESYDDVCRRNPVCIGGDGQGESVEEIRANIVRHAEKEVRYDSGYGFLDSIGKYPSGKNKCNAFVADMCSLAGAAIPLKNDKFGNKWPPLAGTWGNPNVEIPGWKVVLEPQPGDIIAQKRDYLTATGHVGIVADKERVISARNGGVSKDFISSVFGSGSGVEVGPIVIRRYVGEAE